MTGRRALQHSYQAYLLFIVEFLRRIRDHLSNRASISLVNKSNSSFVVLGEGLQKVKKLTREIAVFTLLSAGPFLKALSGFLACVQAVWVFRPIGYISRINQIAA